jgi:hypothetical protein
MANKKAAAPKPAVVKAKTATVKTDPNDGVRDSHLRASPPNLVPVVFTASSGGYSAGEIAGFDKAVAAQLVKRKVAKLYKAEKTKPEPQGTITK